MLFCSLQHRNKNYDILGVDSVWMKTITKKAPIERVKKKLKEGNLPLVKWDCLLSKATAGTV